MPELLLELFSEEIPARFQRRAAADLKKAVTDALVEAGLVYEGASAFVTPRRLALTVAGLPGRSPDTRETRKGPRTDAPPAAIEGFLKAAGLASTDQARIETDPKKGQFYVADIEKPGADATAILATLLPRIVSGFQWAKSMRWGDGDLAWVRPLRAITATFGTDNDEPVVIPFEADGLASGQETFGHRFLAPQPIRVKRFEDYSQSLERARVVLDLDRRKEIIRTDAEHLAFAQGLTVIHDEGLLEEVAGLVEWPVVMMGSFDAAYLAVPEEVIIATIRTNQKCFCLRGADGRLANRFILTANTIAADGGATITAGNERVIRARLSDASFFYEQDLRLSLEHGLPQLEQSVFHQQLGSQFQRVERLVKLAAEIAPLVGADVDDARRAAMLCKADLVTGMVGEFPELQGLMGRYYALAQGEKPEIANAIEAHYRPLGPTDSVPTEPVAIAVALADKLDLLTGFWAINEKPTGSRDPFALRRAALGVIRIVVENGLKLSLISVLREAAGLIRLQLLRTEVEKSMRKAVWQMADGQPELIWPPASVGGSLPSTLSFDDEVLAVPLGVDLYLSHIEEWELDGRPLYEVEPLAEGVSPDLPAHDISSIIPFFHDRLRVALRERGQRHDLVEAVLSAYADDLLQIVQRTAALRDFLATDTGAFLLAGYRRAVNLLSDEEKKENATYPGVIQEQHLTASEEIALVKELGAVSSAVEHSVYNQEYGEAMAALATLRAPVDAFFEAVLVNDPDPEIRANRLNLLARLRDTMHLVADFSKVAG